MCSGRLQYVAPKQDFEEPSSDSRSDHYGKLGLGSTDRSNGRGKIIPSAVSNDRFHASTPNSSKSAQGRVSRAPRGLLAARNCTRDEGGPFEFGDQEPISSHRELLSSRAMVASVAETSGHDPGRHRIRKITAMGSLATLPLIIISPRPPRSGKARCCRGF